MYYVCTFICGASLSNQRPKMGQNAVGRKWGSRENIFGTKNVFHVLTPFYAIICQYQYLQGLTPQINVQAQYTYIFSDRSYLNVPFIAVTGLQVGHIFKKIHVFLILTPFLYAFWSNLDLYRPHAPDKSTSVVHLHYLCQVLT